MALVSLPVSLLEKLRRLVDVLRRTIATLLGCSEEARVTRRARYRKLLERYHQHSSVDVAPETAHLVTLIAQTHSVSRAITRRTKRDRRMQSLQHKIRDAFNRFSNPCKGVMAVGLLGMLLVIAVHGSRLVGEVFVLIWLLGYVLWLLIDSPSLFIRIALSITELWNPAEKWGWTTFNDAASLADRKLLRRLRVFRLDDAEFVNDLFERRLDDARKRVIGMRVFAGAIVSIATYLGFRQTIINLVQGVLPHVPPVNSLIGGVCLAMFVVFFGAYLLHNPSDVLATQLALAETAAKGAERREK